MSSLCTLYECPKNSGSSRTDEPINFIHRWYHIVSFYILSFKLIYCSLFLASNIYGSENCLSRQLRFGQMGMLNFTYHPVNGLKSLLPQTSSNPECMAPSGYCFLSGDHRVSEQPSLACKHIF